MARLCLGFVGRGRGGRRLSEKGGLGLRREGEKEKNQGKIWGGFCEELREEEEGKGMREEEGKELREEEGEEELLDFASTLSEGGGGGGA